VRADKRTRTAPQLRLPRHLRPPDATSSRAAWLATAPGAEPPAAAGPLGRLAALLLARPAPTYPGHVPLSALQQAAVALLASAGAAADPRRADLVAAVGETTGGPALRALRARLAATPAGAALLAERPRLTDAALARAGELPPSTLGGAYAAFMGARGFRADDRPPPRFVADPELAWVAARLREVHDFWHVLFACPTDLLGETALKALEFVHTGLPMAGAAAAAGAAGLPPAGRAALIAELLPWAARAGRACEDLTSLRYEDLLDEDLEALRARLRVEPAPPRRK
jgi:ubiquinone biosynthesis protein COQ4